MNIEQELKSLFEKELHDTLLKIVPLPRSASYRQYFRLIGNRHTVIGTYNPNPQENEAFLYMSHYFREHGLNVPVIYAKDIQKNIYLQQDLGSQTLLNHIKTHKTDKIKLLKQALDWLVRFQTIDLTGFDWTKTYPAPAFTRDVYMFDLNYFKYMVLRLLKVQYNDMDLDQEFNRLVEMLLSVPHEFFVFRDFQSRNIMVHDGQLYFIDYQGGRRGSIFYDLVSLLYDTKLELTPDEMRELEEYYYTRTKHLHNMDLSQFHNYVLLFALVRKLQALAAYCFRGLVENKITFLTGVEKAFTQVMQIIDTSPLGDQLPLLTAYLHEAAENLPFKRQKVDVELEINSFSYLHGGYPENKHGNGGGFVFDCRLLPNPFWQDHLRDKTGLDREVGQWLEAQPGFEDFIVTAFRTVYQAVVNYQQKGYSHLQVNFGCTGGQHRSVYCAEKMAWLLGQFFDTKITVNHTRYNAAGE